MSSMALFDEFVARWDSRQWGDKLRNMTTWATKVALADLRDLRGTLKLLGKESYPPTFAQFETLLAGEKRRRESAEVFEASKPTPLEVQRLVVRAGGKGEIAFTCEGCGDEAWHSPGMVAQMRRVGGALCGPCCGRYLAKHRRHR